MTWKEKYNKKYNNSKDVSNSLSDISKDTGVSMKGLQQIYNKGIGAYKTNPESLRPNVTSKEQWAMARVYSAVMGGKASEVDAKELKMEKGGTLSVNDRLQFYKDYYKRLTPSDFQVDLDENRIIITPEFMNTKDNYFKKGGETNFNPDGKIKDKIVHASGEAGGMLVGKRHSTGGIKAINKSTGQPLEMEGGEVVITRNAVSDPQKRMFNGKYMTNRQILSKINESGGGVSFADGGEVPDEILVDANMDFNFCGKDMCGSDLAKTMGGGEFISYTNSLKKGGLLESKDLPKRLSEATFVKSLGGSTGAELYEYLGNEIVVKTGNSVNHAKEEYVANVLYSLLDINVPASDFINGYYLVKDYITNTREVNWNNISEAEKVLKGFVADALLANYDIYKNDNILYNEDNQKVYRIDNGGSLRYRAQGGLKDDFSSDAVKDIESIKSNNPFIIPYLTDEIIIDGINEIQANFSIIYQTPILLDIPIDNKYKLSSKLKDRIQSLIKYRRELLKNEVIEVGDIAILSNQTEFKPFSKLIVTDISPSRIIIELENPETKEKKDYGINEVELIKKGSKISTTKVNDEQDNSTKQIKKPSIDDIKDKVVFNTDKGFAGKSLFTGSRIGQDLYDEYEKLNKDFETLEKLLPLFQDSKDSDKRAMILSEMKRLRRKIDYGLDVEINEMQALQNDLFTTEGLLNYYYKQSTQSPVNKDLKPCNLPTPNGKKSKLPISAYLNVRTEQFKRWFGDWQSAYNSENYVNCSVMIDEDTKEPKMYFHGVRKFAGGRGQSAMGAGINRPFGDFNPTNFSASYFADNEEYAKFYAGTSENLPQQERRSGFVYPVFLNVRQPIDVRPLGFETSYKDLIDYLAVKYGVIADFSTDLITKLGDKNTKNPVWNYIRNDELLLQTLRDYGYDGLFQIGDIPKFDENGDIISDRSKWDKDNEYLTFSPNQVKSVTVKKSMYLNIFDDIRFNKGGYVSI